MTQEYIITYLKEHKEEFSEKFGVTKLGLFGSYARNEARADSDIDILIELKKDISDIYEKKTHLRETIENFFHKKVDIAREKYLKPIAREEILKEVKFV